MKVRIEYTVRVDDFYRRAIALHNGDPGLATRKQVKEFIFLHGTNMDDEILAKLEESENSEYG